MNTEIEDLYTRYGANKLLQLTLSEKLTLTKNFLNESLRAKPDTLALCWTGGKDSTLLLWLTREVCHEQGLQMPLIVTIDELDTFPEIRMFIQNLSDLWNMEVITLYNKGLASRHPILQEPIPVAELDHANQTALMEIGYIEPYFPFEPESVAGNHLTKTVPLRTFIKNQKITGLFVALRWDEHIARAKESPVSLRNNPPHSRLHPMLYFRECDVWNIIMQYKVPFCELYRNGYRSLGARSATRPVVPGIPAWEQDLDATSERQGRGQDKELAMEQLRALGYM
ncbi:phosphoadenosine phosphosulfate reductase family protein [uncultured Desulfobacter sp.]|uniref:phosphoadenosine phosphosulfate reductase family protein n=1 Tax=uncultured Desulfobacter sp. TaxID=240139 RepID=UPI0029F55DF4|nr:phosphoadenosine phosphosulfate reductase family protein [uncultured Desulfobacter sp.]